MRLTRMKTQYIARFNEVVLVFDTKDLPASRQDAYDILRMRVQWKRAVLV